MNATKERDIEIRRRVEAEAKVVDLQEKLRECEEKLQDCLASKMQTDDWIRNHSCASATGKLEELLAQVELMTEALKACGKEFSEIRSDWSDPRSNCREGQRLIRESLESPTLQSHLKLLEAKEAVITTVKDTPDDYLTTAIVEALRQLTEMEKR